MKYLSKQHKQFVKRRAHRKALIGPIASGKTVAGLQYVDRHKLRADCARVQRHDIQYIEQAVNDFSLTNFVISFEERDSDTVHFLDQGGIGVDTQWPALKQLLATEDNDEAILLLGNDYMWLPYVGHLIGWGFDVTILPAVGSPRVVKHHLPADYYRYIEHLIPAPYA